MTQIFLLGVILLIILGRVACTSPTPTSTPNTLNSAASSSPSNFIDPCSLLTSTDVAQALGEPVVLNPMREMVSDGSLCSYFIGERVLVITSRQFDRAGAQTAKQELQDRYKTGQAIPGIGEIAFFSFHERTLNPNAKAGTLALMKGDIALEISLTDVGLSETKASDMLKFLAQRAVARLP